ncbi:MULTISPECIES: PAS domain S-box protein [unclassified Novosphingobium]|uniref:sensor histidine kinase n=1 Tax=unclassified Novosphingobium TaxID=2644732 RepID=UPI001F29072E|nr:MULTISPECIES: PAS domain S-box protein [unclassified Novosphingobium]
MTLAAHIKPDIQAPLVHAPIGAMIVDTAGVIAWANTACATLLAEPDPESLRNGLLFVMFGEEDAEMLRQMFEVFFGAPIEQRDPWTRKFTLHAADGSRPAISLTLTPIAGEDDGRAVIYLRNTTRELTAERRFTQMFETLPLGLVVVDGRGRIAQANAMLATQFGYPVVDMIGQPLNMLLPERYRDAHVHQLAGYRDAAESRMMAAGRDLTGLHSAGREFPVEVALTRFENPGQPLFMAIVSDITHRKRSETALQQTNAQLEEFTYVASHDLRSPLRGIGDLVTWIREDLDEAFGKDSIPESARHNFDRITQRIARCEQMIDDLLSYARAGVRDPQMHSIDPRELVEEAMAMSRIPDSFTVDVEIGGADLIAPRAPLSTSLRNLISNAVKHHGGESGRIRIAMREEGRFSVFTVEDDGQGIPPGNEERIFKLFHRASPGTDGDGVGLAFTRRMINAHGGMVSVLGNGPLGGATFEVHWPRILLRENDDE